MNKIIAALIIISTLPETMAVVYAEPVLLKTQTGNNIGISLSSYKYEEPEIMSAKGSKMGLDLRLTKVLQDEQFIRGELRYAFGTVDYNGSGNLNGELDWYIEARGLVGKDWVLKDAVVSSYTGLGYRYLFNDGRGLSCNASTCYWGYRRESNYLYWPIGIIHHMAIEDHAKLISTLEYDHLLAGRQISRLSDGGQGDSDMTNPQNSGHGLKLNIMYQKNNWAIGPFLHYWNIGKSDIALLYKNGTLSAIGWEPKNNTIEFGIMASQQF